MLLFAKPATLLARDWWKDPDAGHGLLLFPVALWLAWRRGIRPDAAPSPWLGALLLVGSVVLRLAAELAAELFTMRLSMVGAAAGLVVFFLGVRQLLHWWLPVVHLGLAIPLPELIRSALALPLQFRASALGAALLDWRHVPVRLTGNIIQLPGHQLFVTEACSGLRSLTALLSLGFLTGGLWLHHPMSRATLVLATVPIAILLNGIRVFVTGFLVYYVDPALGEGFMHLTEGWLLFLVSLLLVGAVAWLFHVGERWLRRRGGHA